MPELLRKPIAILTKLARSVRRFVPSRAQNPPGQDEGPKLALVVRLAALLREQFAAVAVLGLGIAVSAVLFVATQRYFRSGERQEFDRQAAHYVQTVVNSTQRYEKYILDLGNRFEGPTPMDRWQFDDYSQDRLERYKGLKSLLWIPYVSGDRRDEFEARARDDGLFGFRIRERGPTGSLVPAGPRAFYLPIYYAVPFDTDQKFLGIDLHSVEQFRPVLDAAGKDGEDVVLRKAWIAGLTSDAREFQVIRPVYASASNADIGASPRQRLRGFVGGVLRLDTIVQSVIRELTTPAWLDIYVYSRENSHDGDLLLYLPSRLRANVVAPLGHAQVEKGFLSRANFNIGDKELSVVVKPVATKYNMESSLLPYWAGSFGILLTCFISYNMAVARTRARVIEQTVTERTAALSEANIALHNEILERQRAEMEMRRAKDQAEVANRAKSEFLAMVSHELRTPLNAIIGFSDIMSQGVFGPVGSEKYVDYVNDIQKSGTHLLGLINNILDLSKVESGRFRLDDQKVSLKDGIAEILRLVSELAETGGVALDSEIPDDLPQLRGDRQAIRQVLLNLLSNAIKFTEADGHVCIGAKVDEMGQLVLAIEDTGIGIPDEDVESVFQPFTQVDSSLARQFEGTGLGLTLTRSLVEMHGGSVALESELGKGTKVTVTFPRERVIGATTH